MDSGAESIFEDDGASSDFVPAAPKARGRPKGATAKAPKKPAAATKAKAPAKKLTQTTLKKTTTKPAAKKRKAVDSEDEIPEDDDDDDNAMDDGSMMSSTPPNAAKSSTKRAAKKVAKEPLTSVENESFGTDGTAGGASKGGSTERYQKLTQLEHIIKRPDTYIGSIERTERHMWVFNSKTSSMEYREVSYVPGLYKIFDEILVNAADNKQNDKNMDEIRVTVDREAGEISVWNNGRGIPIEIHAKEGIYIPELIFGHLLTSSNYDDDEKKVTGGRNGYGAKLCNVFSTEFTLETADSRQKKKYKQTWTDNMSKMGKAKITDCKGDDYTKVTFKPDFKKFGMEGMDDDFEALAMRRVYDLAGTAKVKVKLNGSRIPVNNFKKYMEMYTNAIKNERGEEAAKDKSPILVDNPDPRWEVGFAVSDGAFQQVSFVNSIATTSGGTHVNYIADQICNRLAEHVKKKNKGGAQLKTAQIKNHIFVFVNCLVVNPAFTSQTKEQLTTKHTQFGSKPTLSEDFLKKILKTQVMENILHFAQAKADQIMKKTDGSRRSRMNNPKLTDANKAGTKEGHHCTLILTEGDSAKGLAMAGRAIVGPDLFGVFPLRGKLLNVRDASIDQISKNTEIQNIKNFLGLQHKKEYTDTKGLRYGHLMIMTDQDHDGSHIKGLLINFLQVQFPSLLRLPHFLIEFITPIIKVWKGDPKNPTQSKSFFTMPEYEAWKKVHGHDKKWEKKYYKGLGTSSTQEAQVYFQDLDRHLKEFHTMQDNEPELIDLVFSKKKADERKEWLRLFKPGTYLDHSTDMITYTDFVNKELILFSMADNIRSIPSVVDGLKPGQRKVLYTCFKRNIKKDIKVFELAGYVSGMTAYQHGDASLQQTIVGLAQDFVGSNNVNYLEPSGNFGSRLQGGSDCASARYIYTRLSPFARKIFHTNDEPLLKHNIDEGKPIEPEVYLPVIPTILVNGADGIGTGWSTSIPNYNPEDIVANLKRMMAGEPTEPMKPWFRGFTGEVISMGGDRYKFCGRIQETGDNEVEITELPIRVWTQDFKDKLEEIIKAEKVPSFIKDYKDYNTHTKVHFIIQMDEKHIKKAIEDGGLDEKFKLSKTMTTTNLVAFDPEGRITKYATVDDIMKEFYGVRIKYYEKRKQWQLGEMQTQLDRFTNQARFIQMIIDGKLVVSKKPRKVLIEELKEKGFKPISKSATETRGKVVNEAEVITDNEGGDSDDGDEDEKVGSDAYDYLLGMPIWSLTKERVEKLRRQIGDKELEIDELIKLSKEDLWRRDLDDFLEEWKFQLDEESRREKKVTSRGRRTSSKLKTAGGRATAKKRKGAGDDDDSDFAAPKSKKAATINKVKPKGGMLDFLSKTSPKPKKSATPMGLDGASDEEDDDFEAEVMPTKKSRAAPAKFKAPPPEIDIPSEMEDVQESVAPQKRADAGPAPAKVAPIDEDSDGEAVTKPFARQAATKAKKSPVDEDSDVEVVTKPAPRQARTNRKPVTYDVDSASDSDNGDDLLGDVSQMVKGLKAPGAEPASDSRTLFSELSRPGTSSETKTASKPAKPAAGDDLDETDYSKLIPQNSPRRSLLVKPKDITKFSDEDEDAEAPKPAASKPGPKGKAPASKPAPKAKTTTTARGKATTAGKPAAAAPKKPVLSPAAKAYANKKAKASKKLAGDSDDDIDAMANDILDSGNEDDDDDDDGPVAPARKPAAAAPASSRPSRRAATTSKKPTYVIDDDSEEDDFDMGGGDESSDDFEDDDD